MLKTSALPLTIMLPPVAKLTVLPIVSVPPLTVTLAVPLLALSVNVLPLSV